MATFTPVIAAREKTVQNVETGITSKIDIINGTNKNSGNDENGKNGKNEEKRKNLETNLV